MADIRAKWLRFIEQPQGRRKTRIWHVVTLDGSADLGEIRWHAPWRKYAFFPDARTIFEPDCLDDLASFCRGQTNNRREVVRQAKLAEAPGVPDSWR